jgi:hypothetical protein
MNRGDLRGSLQEEKTAIPECGWTDEDFMHIRDFFGNGRRNILRHEFDERQSDICIEDRKTGKIVIIKNDGFKTQQILKK